MGEGILAASRDLLETQLPYGTKVRVAEIREDVERCGGYDPGIVLEVQDTMAESISHRVDLWLPTRSEAEAWGICVVVLEVVAYD